MKKLFFIIGAVVILTTATAQPAVPPPCPFACTPGLLQDDSMGMQFLFPVVPSLLATDPLFPKYKYKKTDTGDTVYRAGLRYSNLSGKVLTIVKIDSMTLKNYPGGNHVQYTIKLQDKTTGTRDTIRYQTTVERTILTSTGNPDLRNAEYVIQGAIYLAEVEQAHRLLQGKTFWALFPISGKKFEQVTITNVVPGTFEAPLRVHYSAPGVPDATADVNCCGTNVLSTYIKQFHFSKYFTCTNLRGGMAADRWDLVQKGKPVIGMTITETVITLGKPQKVVETIDTDGTKTEYTYSNYILEFTNGIASSIKKTSN
jgi:hypothetical protein